MKTNFFLRFALITLIALAALLWAYSFQTIMSEPANAYQNPEAATTGSIATK